MAQCLAAIATNASVDVLSNYRARASGGGSSAQYTNLFWRDEINADSPLLNVSAEGVPGAAEISLSNESSSGQH